MFPVHGYVRFKEYSDELPVSLVCVWLTYRPAPPETFLMQQAILRPQDVMRLKTGQARARHDEACARFPGAIVDTGVTIIFEGPVRPIGGGGTDAAHTAADGGASADV